MAMAPKSFINNYVNQNRPQQHNPANAPAPTPAAAPTPTPAAAQGPAATKPTKTKPAGVPTRPASRPAGAAPKRKPGFFKKALGAVASTALRDTGHLGKHIVRSISENEGGVPTNSASGPIAGLGTNNDSQGEPGVKKKRKAPRLSFKIYTRAKTVGV